MTTSDRAMVALATNVRRLRQLRGLSSAELARRSGVGPATLSLLERAQGNPTLETLEALSDTLGTSLGDLLEGDRRLPVTVVRATQGARVSRPNLDLRFVHRFTMGSLNVVELYEMTVPPGEPHRSRGHAGVENILVTSGRLLAGPTDDPVELDEGDFIAYPADGPHLYQSLTPHAARAALTIRHGSQDQRTRDSDPVILALGMDAARGDDPAAGQEPVVFPHAGTDP